LETDYVIGSGERYMKFSERMGYVSPRTELQIESMDKELRTGLWNIFYDFFRDLFEDPDSYDTFHRFIRKLWMDFYNLPLQEMPLDQDMALRLVCNRYNKGSWNEVYDFVEYVAKPARGTVFIKRCNSTLEKYASGYRFVGEFITPITNDSEITSIEETLDQSVELGLEGVKNHIQSALSMLSDRKEPDYRNSIKESISAVESICKLIVDKPKTTLSKALNTIENKIEIHPALKKGFAFIYNYTSDEEGIRHAMMDDNECDFEDAKYMLVSCSAFVNYLIMKAQKAGIDLSSKKQ
jgi:hypothetical protein